ncbi:hypothetical protein ACFVHW_04270 [Streptomyces sp. NPDC127110]|uniref:hypothetical protein n=1 Tax=Streptomyces sp. NPDC127110 TaxID=3345362 RepID=UPI00362CC4FB
MIDREAIVTILDRLIANSDDCTAELIHQAARDSGYLWRCGNPECAGHNPTGDRYCDGCGWGSEGKPVGDIEPSLYAVPVRKWHALRLAVAAHFAQLDGEKPDAVIFDYEGGPGWRGATVHAMYGGRAEPVVGGFRDRAEHEDIADALDGLTRFEKPQHCEHMRIVLPS